jgi:hypothetical protein
LDLDKQLYRFYEILSSCCRLQKGCTAIKFKQLLTTVNISPIRYCYIYPVAANKNPGNNAGEKILFMERSVVFLILDIEFFVLL